jgi:stringent starvation protein B
VNSESPMTSSKPYLIRAFYEWIVDNDLTPYLLVNANAPNCLIPEEHVKDGKIIFNITGHIVHGLLMSNDAIKFSARFSGAPRHVYIPVYAVLAIYAKENGEGMAFPEESPPTESPPTPDKKRGKPDLRIVK